MNKFFSVAAAASVAVCAMSSVTFAEGKVIGVSWSNFQEERWKTDEAAMKAAIEANGDKYISADAQLSASKQLDAIAMLPGCAGEQSDAEQAYTQAKLGHGEHGPC